MKNSAKELAGKIEVVKSRREATAALAAVFGAAAIGGCLSSEHEATDRGVSTQQATGADLRWVDTVLGSNFPTSRNGDLAMTTGPAMGATMAFAKGCRVAGDGGGGLFYWDATGGKDNGGTVIVPAGTVGTVGPCWRRVR